MLKRIAEARPVVVASTFVIHLALSSLALYIFWSGPIEVVVAVLAAFFELLLFGWLLAIGLHFNSLLSHKLTLGDAWPKVAFVFAVAYCSVSFLLFDPATHPSLQMAMFPLHVLTVVANFYLLWFGVRSLRTFELGHAASLNESAGLFVLVWLLSVPLPIGPFLVQRRVRALSTKQRSKTHDFAP